MKKTITIMLLVLFLSGLFAGCTDFKLSQKTDIFSQKETDMFSDDKKDETSPEIVSSVSYSKVFKGGSGYVTDSKDCSHYEYTGGEMKIDIAIENDAYAFECGVFVVLNGVFQTFTLTDDSGNTSSSGYMHSLDTPNSQTVDMTLTFTPNIGKSGDILNLAVGTMTEPSYTCVYSGWPHYSKYGYHNYTALSGMCVHMKCDSVENVKSASNLKIEKAKISDYYYNNITDGDQSAEDKLTEWKSTQSFPLYYDAFDFNKDIIVIPDEEKVTLNMDILGKKADYRVSLFINHEPINFENNSTYFDVTSSEDSVTHIEISLDVSDVPRNSHIYAVISEYDKNEDSLTKGTYIYTDKTATYFFIKSQLPEAETSTDTTEEISQSTTQSVVSSESESVTRPVTGNITMLEDFFINFAAVLDNDTLCFVGRINDGAPKAVFCENYDGGIINTVDLGENARYYAAVNGTLIYADNHNVSGGKCTVIDKNANVLRSFVYNDENFDTEQGGLLAFNAIPRVTFNCLTGDMLHIVAGTDDAATYCHSISDGQMKKLDFLSRENVPIKIDCFAGENILILTVTDNESNLKLFNADGKIVKEIKFSGAKNLTTVGQYAVVFERKNSSGISKDNKAVLMDCLTGKSCDLTFNSNGENQWCTVSNDGKYVLTKEIARDIFRIYTTEDSSLVKEFTVENFGPGVTPEKVLIDSKNRTIYMQNVSHSQGGNECYGIAKVSF